MTPEEEAGLLEQGQTQEQIDAQKAQEATAAQEAATKKAADDKAAREAVVANLTPEEIERTSHYKGTIHNLQQERAERQRLEAENLRLKTDADAARIRAEQQIAAEDTEKVLTVGEFNRRVEARIAQIQKDAETKRMQDDAVAVQQRLAESEDKARKEYTAEAMGAGLDYDSVFKATERLIAANPAYAQVILRAPDPAREAYRIGSLDPQIQVLREARLQELTISKIKTGGAPPKIAGGSGAGTEAPTGEVDIEELINLSPEEVRRRTEALEQQGG